MLTASWNEVFKSTHLWPQHLPVIYLFSWAWVMSLRCHLVANGSPAHIPFSVTWLKTEHGLVGRSFTGANMINFLFSCFILKTKVGIGVKNVRSLTSCRCSVRVYSNGRWYYLFPWLIPPGTNYIAVCVRWRTLAPDTGMVLCFLIHTVGPVISLSHSESRILYSRVFGAEDEEPSEESSEENPEKSRLARKERLGVVARWPVIVVHPHSNLCVSFSVSLSLIKLHYLDRSIGTRLFSKVYARPFNSSEWRS